MKTLEAVNQILLQAGERQVRDISSPPSLKAQQVLGEAIQEFSLLEDWAYFTRWITPTQWAGNTAYLPDNVIKIIGCRVGDTLQTFVENWNTLDAGQWTIGQYNTATVYNNDDVNDAVVFQVVLLPSLPLNDTLDIDIPKLYLVAILKRALGKFVLRHLDDAALASQITAEYELMLTQLRSRDRQRPNGSANIYRNGR